MAKSYLPTAALMQLLFTFLPARSRSAWAPRSHRHLSHRLSHAFLLLPKHSGPDAVPRASPYGTSITANQAIRASEELVREAAGQARRHVPGEKPRSIAGPHI